MKSDTSFKDVLFLLILVLLILPHHPETQQNSKPPGMVIVEIRWPDNLDVDVDLWCLAPGDRPVGYSNRAGEVFNLLRDDLGMQRDHLSGLNYENIYSRGAPPGEYVVNVHLYAVRGDAKLPIKVDVQASISRTGSTQMIFHRTVYLRSLGQEITVNRFSLDKQGYLVPNSIYDMPKELRSWALSQ